MAGSNTRRYRDHSLCAGSRLRVGSYNPPPKLVISAITLPAGLVGNTYNTSFAATGGITPYTWTLYSGSLPVGMNLGSSGSLAGTPTTAGQFTLTVQVADSETPQATATQQVMLTINPAPPALYVSQTLLPEGVVNTAYSATIQVAGGLPPYSFSLTQGSLPPGLTLSGTGVVSGTPTQAGASSFTVQVSDAESPPQTTSSPIYITIVATPLAISTTTLPDAVVNVPYYQQLQVTGGVPPYTWQEQNLGQGFFLIDGAVTTSPFGFVEWPKQVGTASFTVTVMDSAQQVASQSLSVTIDLGGNVLLNGRYTFMASGFGARRDEPMGGGRKPGGRRKWQHYQR